MAAEKTAAGSQTLDRGIRILEALAEAREPRSIDRLAAGLGLHRSIVYRLVRTLEEHGLVIRTPEGGLVLGPRLAALAAGVGGDLQTQALPELTAVANELGMTCFLAVRDGDECITLASVEPRHAVASVVQRPGARHSITVGAPSKAILSALPPAQWPGTLGEESRAELAEAAQCGFATSHDEVIPTVRAVAVPVRQGAGRRPAAIAVVHVGTALTTERIADRLRRSAAAIGEALGG